MTVKELKNIFETIPDDTKVLIDNGCDWKDIYSIVTRRDSDDKFKPMIIIEFTE